ncbi:hypothetical protein D6D19_08001 [Aureobasidium pullulans]|uniref:Uncharacterized protein n=1 Tax=Aureobasidium pullulans TaxID=5580 RepID=A0A4S8ZUQ1_AURPU|nr:hypothetical protein D6D19_08001 [Aureobasidium pullulans]THY22342.1 hypothetical protein D6D00_06940 [Aureobasidium pullulans]
MTFQHDETTAPYTIGRPTTIRMPMLGQETHLAAAFILDDRISVDMINEFLEIVREEHEMYHLWLAEDTLRSYPTDLDKATVPPVSSSWRSPFAGNTIEEAFTFMSCIPTDKDITMNRTYIVVLDRDLYGSRGWVVVCKIDEESTITTAPCAARNAMLHINSLSWHLWPNYLERWRNERKPFLS